jgi:hypothetical protein
VRAGSVVIADLTPAEFELPQPKMESETSVSAKTRVRTILMVIV